MRISNCSRESLFTCGERITVYRLRSVGRGDRTGNASAGLLSGLDDELRGQFDDLVIIAP